MSICHVNSCRSCSLIHRGVSYTVATRNAQPPPNEDGSTRLFLSFSFHNVHIVLARREATTSWHSVLSFNPSANNYLKNLKKGYQVYVEANYELKDADPSADPDTPAAQRQIFLRHGMSRSFFLNDQPLFTLAQIW